MSIWVWVVFNLFVIAMIILDLKMFNRDAHEIELREALIWAVIWVVISIFFGIGIYLWQGAELGLAFFTGYLLEKSLSVDNIFVFLMIFSYFSVPAQYQRRVLTWGILGAVILRAIFIYAGVTLLEQFHWMIYVFGGFLIFTAFKMLRSDDEEIDPDRNPVINLAKRFLPVTSQFSGENFFIRDAGKLVATPLFIVLLMIETTDVIFALDSIPAILGVTKDPFIVYTSNILAILGLRALYFALAGIVGMFHYLRYGLAGILAFVGVKMVISGFVHIPTSVALGVVAGLLILSVIASLIWPQVDEAPVHVVQAQPDPAD